MQEFEKMLLDRGYKKWTRCLHGQEDYDVSRLIKDDDGEHLYQIIFRFWDWTKYGRPEMTDENEASVDWCLCHASMEGLISKSHRAQQKSILT